MNQRVMITTFAGLAACLAVALAPGVGRAIVPTPAQDSAGIFDATPFTSTDGRAIYEHVCRGCHMPDAAGAVGAGHYPALARNPTLKSREYMVMTVLLGRRNMPAFGEKHAIGFTGPPLALNDAQVAAVVNYVRSNFGNHYRDAVSAADVAKLDPGKR
jgi:mono/diheme cytochrome c family protein